MSGRRPSSDGPRHADHPRPVRGRPGPCTGPRDVRNGRHFPESHPPNRRASNPMKDGAVSQPPLVVLFDPESLSPAEHETAIASGGYRTERAARVDEALAVLERDDPAALVVVEGRAGPADESRVCHAASDRGIPVLGLIDHEGDGASLKDRVKGYDGWTHYACPASDLIARLGADAQWQGPTAPPTHGPIPIDVRLLAMIVHDIRNPLNVIGLTLRVIEQLPAPQRAEVQEDLNFLRDNAGQVEKILGGAQRRLPARRARAALGRRVRAEAVRRGPARRAVRKGGAARPSPRGWRSARDARAGRAGPGPDPAGPDLGPDQRRRRDRRPAPGRSSRATPGAGASRSSSTAPRPRPSAASPRSRIGSIGSSPARPSAPASTWPSPPGSPASPAAPSGSTSSPASGPRSSSTGR